ncbi:MAG: hypothetical protein M1837_003333 [Sclerophora amabilis]|nr:MAG: hypothetical protein M1837_003333 [Sclerophora amabilis]
MHSNPSTSTSSPAAFHDRVLAALPQPYRQDYVSRLLAPMTDHDLLTEVERRRAEDVKESTAAATILCGMRKLSATTQSSTSLSSSSSPSTPSGGSAGSNNALAVVSSSNESGTSLNHSFQQYRPKVAQEPNRINHNAETLGPRPYDSLTLLPRPPSHYTRRGLDAQGRLISQQSQDSESAHPMRDQDKTLNGHSLTNPIDLSHESPVQTHLMTRDLSAGYGRPLPPIPTHAQDHDDRYKHQASGNYAATRVGKTTSNVSVAGADPAGRRVASEAVSGHSKTSLSFASAAGRRIVSSGPTARSAGSKSRVGNYVPRPAVSDTRQRQVGRTMYRRPGDGPDGPLYSVDQHGRIPSPSSK